MAILTDANDILIDLNGEIAYLQDTVMWIRDETDTTQITATMITNNSDLGETSVEKLLNSLDVDYVGAFNVSFYLDGDFIHTMVFDNIATRDTVWRAFPLALRKPFQKLSLYITASVIGTKIYSLEVDFKILKRRRYN